MLPISDKDPLRKRFPPATAALIFLTSLCFAYQLHSGDPGLLAGRHSPQALQLFSDWGFVPAQIVTNPTEVAAWTGVLSYTVVHVSLLHLAANMLFLWVFGPTIEGRAGTGPFLALYLAAGAGAALTHLTITPDSPGPLVGASGAVSGILGAYLATCPTNRIKALYPTPKPGLGSTTFPAWCLLIAWLGWQLTQALISTNGADALPAHLGGLATGLLPALALRSGNHHPR